MRPSSTFILHSESFWLKYFSLNTHSNFFISNEFNAPWKSSNILVSKYYFNKAKKQQQFSNINTHQFPISTTRYNVLICLLFERREAYKMKNFVPMVLAKNKFICSQLRKHFVNKSTLIMLKYIFNSFKYKQITSQNLCLVYSPITKKKHQQTNKAKQNKARTWHSNGICDTIIMTAPMRLTTFVCIIFIIWLANFE